MTFSISSGEQSCIITIQEMIRVMQEDSLVLFNITVSYTCITHHVHDCLYVTIGMRMNWSIRMKEERV